MACGCYLSMAMTGIVADGQVNVTGHDCYRTAQPPAICNPTQISFKPRAGCTAS